MTTTLSEAQSKLLLQPYELPFLQERLVDTALQAVTAAEEMGLPVVAKLCGDTIAHKTERGLVKLGLRNAADVSRASEELFAAATDADGPVQVLIAPMVSASRELIAGAVRDPQFGPTVLLGVGGILAEAISDVVVRLAPLSAIDALEMIESMSSQALLGEFRGEPPVDREALCRVLLALSGAITESESIVSIDLNPLMIVEGLPIAVDALVEVDELLEKGIR
jgi:succinyl-CoA synthetase beta subunit